MIGNNKNAYFCNSDSLAFSMAVDIKVITVVSMLISNMNKISFHDSSTSIMIILLVMQRAKRQNVFKYVVMCQLTQK